MYELLLVLSSTSAIVGAGRSSLYIVLLGVVVLWVVVVGRVVVVVIVVGTVSGVVSVAKVMGAIALFSSSTSTSSNVSVSSGFSSPDRNTIETEQEIKIISHVTLQ